MTTLEVTARKRQLFQPKPCAREDVDQFVAGAQVKIDAYFAKHYSNTPNQLRPSLVIEERQRYFFVAIMDVSQKSAWAFVEKASGYVLKAASYNVPAKHARGTVHTPTHGIEYVDAYGPANLRR